MAWDSRCRMRDACSMQRACALWRRRRRPAPAWPSGSRRSSHWCAHACLRRHARMRTVRRLSQAIIVAVIGTVFKFDDVATATLSSCIAGAHAVAQSVPFAHMRSRRAHTSGARAHAGTNLLVASPVSLWHMSPRPAKHALKGARVRAWPAAQASRQCGAAQGHMLAAPSRVCGAWRSLCGRTTRRRAPAAPHARAALCGSRCMHALRGLCTAVARARVHGKRCTAAHRLLLGLPPGCTGRRVGADVFTLRRVRCERRRSSSSARTASAAPARRESSQSPVCTCALVGVHASMCACWGPCSSSGVDSHVRGSMLVSGLLMCPSVCWVGCASFRRRCVRMHSYV